MSTCNCEKQDALQAQVSELKIKLETERMRLAGCGVAALGYFKDCHPDYDSASLQDTLRLRKECDALQAQVSELTRQRDEAKKDNQTLASISGTFGPKFQALQAQLSGVMKERDEALMPTSRDKFNKERREQLNRDFSKLQAQLAKVSSLLSESANQLEQANELLAESSVIDPDDEEEGYLPLVIRARAALAEIGEA